MSSMGESLNEGNALAPRGSASPAAGAPPAGATAMGGPAGEAAEILAFMQQGHDQQAARYKKLKEARAMADHVRNGLDVLAAMGDQVSQEDVTKEAAKLVAEGFPAAEAAGFLAEMPENGQALQGWVSQMDQTYRQNEEKLTLMTDLVRHQMGVSAMKVLGAHAMVGHHMQQQAGPAGPQNALGPLVQGTPAEPQAPEEEEGKK